MQCLKGKISVIVPVYKVEIYLDKCVKSLVEQTYSNLEIILVDDGSPDRCPQICDRWKEKDNRIIVIHKKNGGLSDARNAGLEIASGDYIAFVDSDDWIDISMYEVMLRCIENEKADICACGIKACYKKSKINVPIKEIVGKSEDILTLIYEDTLYPVAAWNKLYKKECWNNFRFPVGKICEDAFTTYKLVDKADKIVQINTPLYNYRIRENSIMTSSFDAKKMDEEEAWKCNYEYMEKKYPQIKQKAFDFYLQKVNILIHTMSKQQRREFKTEYDKLYKILRRNIVYVLLKSKIPMKQRVKMVLDFILL